MHMALFAPAADAVLAARFHRPTLLQAYIKTLNWYKKNNIGKIRQEIVDRQLTLETLPHTETIHKQYLANVWHKADKEGSLLNYELTGRVRTCMRAPYASCGAGSTRRASLTCGRSSLSRLCPRSSSR